MTKANDVLNQINEQYRDGVPNKCDLCNHLRDGKVDRGVPMKHSHQGFNSPMVYDEGFPLVMYFNDNSILVVVIDRIFTAMEELK